MNLGLMGDPVTCPGSFIIIIRIKWKAITENLCNSLSLSSGSKVILISGNFFRASESGNISHLCTGTGCINITGSSSPLQDSDKQLLALGASRSRCDLCVSSTTALIVPPGSPPKLQKDAQGSLATDEPFRSRQWEHKLIKKRWPDGT